MHIVCMFNKNHFSFFVFLFLIYVYTYIQLIADRVALNLEIIFKTFSAHQNSAHGIDDYYQVMNDKSWYAW